MKLTLIRPVEHALVSQCAVVTGAAMRLETLDRYRATGVRSYTVTHSLTPTFASGSAGAHSNRPSGKETK